MIASKKGRSFGAWYFYGVFLFVIAFVHSLVISTNEKAPGMKKCPHCASIISSEAKICPSCQTPLRDTSLPNGTNSNRNEGFFEGERRIESAKYQDYLVRKYDVKKNEVLGKYIIGDDGFSNIEEVIGYLHAEELKKLSDPNLILEKGKIGPGKTYNYVVYGDGSTVVTHISGYTKEMKFDSLEAAKTALDN